MLGLGYLPLPFILLKNNREFPDADISTLHSILNLLLQSPRPISLLNSLRLATRPLPCMPILFTAPAESLGTVSTRRFNPRYPRLLTECKGKCNTCIRISPSPAPPPPSYLRCLLSCITRAARLRCRRSRAHGPTAAGPQIQGGISAGLCISKRGSPK